MKACILGISLVAALGVVSVAEAKEAKAVDLAAVANAAVQMDPTLALPPGVRLIELFRLHNAKLNTHTSLFHMPQNWESVGWRKEGTLGFMSTDPFENSIMIFTCFSSTPNDFFTSTDRNCEGQHAPAEHLVGNISRVQIPGTVPLYRCVHKWQGKWRHYDTLNADCDGNSAATNDGALGYVFM